MARPQPPNREAKARYDAIHRAVLSGLLSNIGAKNRNDPHEYPGARGGKFHIFPGSSLFKVEPPWVMAGEIVETTKTYCRTGENIHPQRADHPGGHLLSR